MERAGHTTAAMAMRYQHVAEGRGIALAERMSGLVLWVRPTAFDLRWSYSEFASVTSRARSIRAIHSLTAATASSSGAVRLASAAARS